ncbi:hypothetical protein BSKO_10348 [Bryopsis sp. KO-2023]|nr:hypothetical protein BSKO_10348 [Bryopsis sp. KO-2023]
MSGKERLEGDFLTERGHVESSLEQLARTMDGMKLHKRQDVMQDYVMQHDDRKKQLEGLRYFRRMLCEDNNPHVQQIISMGLVPHFVAALRADDFPQLQVEAAWALTNVSAGTTEETSVVVDNGGMSVLVELMNSKKSDLKEQAIWAVGNIAAEGKFRDDLVEKEALQRLLETLTGGLVDLTTRRIGTWALANFVRQRLKALNPDTKPEECTQVVAVLRELLKDDDTDIVIDAAWAVSSMSGWGHHAVDILMDGGVVECLMRLLEEYSASPVLVPVLKAMSTMASGACRHADALLSHKKLMPRVSQLLDLPYSTRVVYNALWLVSNIASKNYKEVRDLLHARIHLKLVRFVKRGVCDQKQVAGPALSNIFLTQDMPHSAWGELIGEEEIEGLCEMLTWNGKSYIHRAIVALQSALQVAASRHFLTCKEQCFLNESYAVCGNATIRKKRIRVKDKERTGRPLAKSNIVAEFMRSNDGYFTLFHLQDHDDQKISDKAQAILNTHFQDEMLVEPETNDENGSDRFLEDAVDIEEDAEDMSEVCATLSKAKLQDAGLTISAND